MNAMPSAAIGSAIASAKAALHVSNCASYVRYCRLSSWASRHFGAGALGLGLQENAKRPARISCGPFRMASNNYTGPR